MSDRDTLQDLLADPGAVDTVDAPAVFAGRYRVVSLIGTGGMGAVYRVMDEQLGEVVALKLLKGGGPETAARLRSEVVMARKVTHPNVVRTFDLGQDGDRLFLTMEYVPGESLGTTLAREGPLPQGRVLSMGRQLASAVAAAHAAGVLHRDLKPDNVLLTDSHPPRAVLTDFGIAQALAGGTGLWAGTPSWMAPEQLRGGPASTRSEVWALGAILYEALTGELASAGVDRSKLEPGLAGVILRCLQPVAEDRFPGARELGAALAELAAITQAPGASRPLAAPAERVLQVAPLRMVGPPDSAYLAEGLTEEIVDAVSAAPGLTVVVGAVPDPRAEALLSGSLRWTGAGPMRVSAKLEATDQGLRIWSKKVSVGAEELLPLGELLARQVAEAMTLSRPSRALSEMSSDSAEAYLRARAMLREHWDSDLRPTADLLVRMLEQNPEEPSILALLARVRSRQAFFAQSVDGHALFELATHAAVRAIRADPGRGEPWLALGQALAYRSRTAEAAAALRRSVQLAPGSADAHRIIGYLLLEAGRLEASVHHLEVAVRSESTIAAQRVLSRAYAYLGEWELARSWNFKDSDEHPIDTAYFAGRMWMWGYHDIAEEALAAIAVAQTRLDAKRRMNLTDMTGALGALGMIVRGEAIPRTLIETAAESVRRGAGQRLVAARCQFIAELAAFLEEDEIALEMVELGANSALEDLTWLDRCPPLERVRSHPRFVAVREVVAGRAAAILSALDGDPQTDAALAALVDGR